MKAYLVSPNIQVFDGTGALTTEAAEALDVIAQTVTSSLRDGGDQTHRAAIWDGASDINVPPTIVALPDPESLIEMVRQLLDPNHPATGDIRSAANCRAATFGHDGQAMICLRHDDPFPVLPLTRLASVTQADWLADSDHLDGTWPCR